MINQKNKKIKENINKNIKTRIINQSHKNFIDNNDCSLLSIIEIEGALWTSIYSDNYFQKKYIKNMNGLDNFIPFILIPIKINNIYKKTDNESMKIFFYKYDTIKLNTKIKEDYIYIKNEPSVEIEEKENHNLFELDKNRKINYILLNKEKSKLIKKLKIIKELDYFNIFKVNKLLEFIENKLKQEIKNKNNYCVYTSINEKEIIELKKDTINKFFKDTKPLNFKILDNNINLNIEEE